MKTLTLAEVDVLDVLAAGGQVCLDWNASLQARTPCEITRASGFPAGTVQRSVVARLWLCGYLTRAKAQASAFPMLVITPEGYEVFKWRH